MISVWVQELLKRLFRTMSIIKLFNKLPLKEKRVTWATIITILRLFLVPFIVVSVIFQEWGIAFWLFVIASFSDVLDGNVARFFDQKTFLGACLDPIVDKILILSVFTILAFVQSPLFSIPKWFVFIILVKEILLLLGTLIFISKKVSEPDLSEDILQISADILKNKNSLDILTANIEKELLDLFNSIFRDKFKKNSENSKKLLSALRELNDNYKKSVSDLNKSFNSIKKALNNKK